MSRVVLFRVTGAVLHWGFTGQGEAGFLLLWVISVSLPCGIEAVHPPRGPCSPAGTPDWGVVVLLGWMCVRPLGSLSVVLTNRIAACPHVLTSTPSPSPNPMQPQDWESPGQDLECIDVFCECGRGLCWGWAEVT